MIKEEKLSTDYKPEALLPEEKIIACNQELVPKNMAAIEKYLKKFIKKLQTEMLKNKQSIKEEQPALLKAEIATLDPNNYATNRLKKVGAKNFVPRVYQQANINQSKSFIWSNFKQEQKRSIHKLATKMPDEVINKMDQQIIFKFGIYEGWEWEDNLIQENKFNLVNNISKQKITVCYEKKEGLVDITTDKKNMMDNNVMTIMLEISRNIQRHSNNNQAVNTIGLRYQDKEILNKLTQYTKALNDGVGLAKNTADQEKLLIIDFGSSNDGKKI